MKLSEVSVKRPVTIIMITLLFVGLAFYLVPGIAVDLFPSVSRPVVMIMTGYPGASPSVVEEQVTQVIERQLSSMGGLERISSVSSSGSSRVQLEFSYDTDLDQAVNDIRAALDRVSRALPADAGAPAVYRFGLSAMAIMQLRVEGTGESYERLQSLARDTVQPQIERVSGVASVDVRGGEQRQISVKVDKDLMAAYGLSLQTVASTLRSRDYTVDSGEIEYGGMVYDVTSRGSLENLRQMENLVVAGRSEDGVRYPIRLEDIAEISYEVVKQDSLTLIDGYRAVQISVTSESGSNSVKVARAVREQLGEIEQSLPENVSVNILRDTTTMISATLEEVYRAALQGMILAMVVLFLFLRNIRSTLIIGFAVPISIGITLMGMYFFDLTLNLITLTGLILALGMTVDNSIVILENIYRYRERGTKLKSSAILGSREMTRAITASTLTTICVFIPLMIWKNDLGMMGQLFEDLVFTVVISLVISLLVAVTVVPALSSHAIPIHTRTQYPLKNKLLRGVDSWSESVFSALQRGYTGTLEFLLRNKALWLTLIAVLFVFSAVTFASMGMNLQPRSSSDDSVTLSLSLPTGTSFGYTKRIINEMAEIVREEIEGYEHLSLRMDRGSGSIQIALPPIDEQRDTPQTIQEKLRPYLNGFPDATFSFSAGRRFSSSSPVDIEIASADMQLAADTALRVRDLLREHIREAVDPVTSLETGGPVYTITVDQAAAASYGLSEAEVVGSVDLLMEGTSGGTFNDGEDEISIEVMLDDFSVRTLDDLRNLPLTLASGDTVPLQAMAAVTPSRGPVRINRENQQRLVHVTAGLREGAAVTEVQPEIEQMLEEYLVVPDGVRITYGGEAAEIETYTRVYMIIIIAAVLMVFAVMASQFESLIDPLIIFFSIPLLIVGVTAVFSLTGNSYSIFSTVGIVVLAGIVVNNGIVLVDYTNLLVRRGYPLYRAAVTAAESRLRPILMTSLTTILSMTPMGFFPGEGMEMIQPIGQTIVGGLAVSTVMTLLVTPVIYVVLHIPKDALDARRREKTAKREAARLQEVES